MSGAEKDGRKVVARNRKALHDYEILERFEAGLVLRGPEVKSLREGKANLGDAYARVENGEVWLHNMHISPYGPASLWNVADPIRTRKLLLQKREIRRLIGSVQEKGLTLVPLDLYFRRGVAKITLALARGRRHRDRREELKKRASERDVERAFKELGQ